MRCLRAYRFSMTTEIILVLTILVIALVLFVSERLRVDVVALCVLITLALCQLVSPLEAVAGFSNPAVITICAVFVLSAGLYQTGVANWIGHHVLGLAGKSEVRLVTLLMLLAASLSFFMNTLGIVALLLPVVMDVARRLGHAPSKLLMPLAFGALLGGLTTMFATLPNLLVSTALQENGFEPFGVFDFLPIGGCAALAGIAFMTLAGRRMLPARDLKKETSARGRVNLEQHYQLQQQMFVLRVPAGSVLVGKKLSESRLGSLLGFHVVGILRDGQTQLAPSPSTPLRGQDQLLVQGNPDQMKELAAWRKLSIEEADPQIVQALPSGVTFAEIQLGAGSLLIGQTLAWVDFRQRYGVTVLAIRRDGHVRRTNLGSWRLQQSDILLVHGSTDRLEALRGVEGLLNYRPLGAADLAATYQLHERLFFLRVTDDSPLAGKTLAQARLGEAMGLTVVAVVRKQLSPAMPDARTVLEPQDRLVVVGRSEDLSILQGLQDLELEREVAPKLDLFESDKTGLVEAVLAPRTALAGKTLRQLNFREKYGLTVLGLLRNGEVLTSSLRDAALKFGDALLLYGPKEKLVLLGREADFVVLTEAVQEPLRTDKALFSVLAMLVFLIPVLAGWIPVHLGAVLGAALMVLTGCMTIEKAYGAIDWKSVVLIAGMLPLGTAMQDTGAARLLAERFISMAGSWGPHAVIAGFYIISSLATCVIPSSAIVVLLAPIALRTAAELGLSPHAVMMALGLAVAGSFNSPISHPANVMIMGPGGYRFADFFRIGIPLTLVVLAVVMIVLPFFWPLTGTP